MNLELNKALEELTREQLRQMLNMIKEMRDDYMCNKSKLVNLGYPVKPFNELLKDELINKL